jgi:hypothetical protein
VGSPPLDLEASSRAARRTRPPAPLSCEHTGSRRTASSLRTRSSSAHTPGTCASAATTGAIARPRRPCGSPDSDLSPRGNGPPPAASHRRCRFSCGIGLRTAIAELATRWTTSVEGANPMSGPARIGLWPLAAVQLLGARLTAGAPVAVSVLRTRITASVVKVTKVPLPTRVNPSTALTSGPTDTRNHFPGVYTGSVFAPEPPVIGSVSHRFSPDFKTSGREISTAAGLGRGVVLMGPPLRVARSAWTSRPGGVARSRSPRRRRHVDRGPPLAAFHSDRNRL